MEVYPIFFDRDFGHACSNSGSTHAHKPGRPLKNIWTLADSSGKLSLSLPSKSIPSSTSVFVARSARFNFYCLEKVNPRVLLTRWAGPNSLLSCTISESQFAPLVRLIKRPITGRAA